MCSLYVLIRLMFGKRCNVVLTFKNQQKDNATNLYKIDNL